MRETIRCEMSDTGWQVKFASNRSKDKIVGKLNGFVNKHSSSLEELHKSRMNFVDLKESLDTKFEKLHRRVLKNEYYKRWSDIRGSQVQITQIDDFSSTAKQLCADITLRDEYHVTCCHPSQNLVGIDAMITVDGTPLSTNDAIVNVKVSDFVHAKDKKTQGDIYFLVVERMVLDGYNDNDSFEVLDESHLQKELQCANQKQLHITLHVNGEGLSNKDAGCATREFKEMEGVKEKELSEIKEKENIEGESKIDVFTDHKFDMHKSIKLNECWFKGTVKHFRE